MDVKIITPPDYDYTNRFKILLVGFEWEKLEPYTHIFTATNKDMAVYLCNSANDIDWCLLTASQAKAILVNCSQQSSFEMLKGYLLSFDNACSFGYNNQTIIAKNIFYDIPVWFTKIAQNNDLLNL